MVADIEPHFHEEIRKISSTPSRSEVYLPTSTVQVHASNLLILDNGDLLCAWFGGSQEGTSDICIYLSRLAPTTTSWTQPQKISNDPDRSEQNPVLFQDPKSKAVWLFHTAQPAGQQDRALVRRRISTDNGYTWTEAAQVFSDTGIFVRQPVIILPDSTWVLPIWHCRTEPGTQWNGNDDISAVRISRDSGNSWHEVAVPDSRGAAHMNIRTAPNGRYVALYRSRWADNIYRSESQDGIHWSQPEPISLPNPNSGIAFDYLPDGRMVLIYNDTRATPEMQRREGLYDDLETSGPVLEKQATVEGREAIWGAPRAKLTMGVSSDDGVSWKTRLLEEGDGFCLTNNSRDKVNRELSYPSIAMGRDGTVHVAFTFWRQRIKYVRLKADYVDG